MAQYGMTHEEGNSSRHAIRQIFVRDYILAFLAFFGFLGAYHALTPTLPLYLARAGSNTREIGVLVGTVGIAALCCRLLAGRLLVRHSERTLMMGGSMLFCLAFLALILFRPFWPYFFIRLLQGIAFASFDTAAIAYVIRIIPERHRARAISYFLLAVSLASAIAASGSVIVLNAYSFAALLLACAGLTLGAFLLSGNLKRQTSARPETPPASGNRFIEPKILAPAIMSFLFSYSLGGVMAFFPLYSVKCGVSNPGYFFTASAVMLIAVRIGGGRIYDLFGKEKIIIAFTLLSIIALLTLSFSHTLFMFVFAGLLWGGGGAFIFPTSMAYALEYAGSSDGTAVGTYQAFMDLGLALGPIFTGIIVPFSGYRLMFLYLAFIYLINISYFQFYIRRRGRKTAAGHGDSSGGAKTGPR